MATANFHNQSFTDLADELGTLDLQIKALTERKDAISAHIKSSRLDRIEGAKFTVTVSASTRVTYDDKAIREALGGPDALTEYRRETETVTVRIKPTVIFGQAAA